jgi:hypothetical protein
MSFSLDQILWVVFCVEDVFYMFKPMIFFLQTPTYIILLFNKGVIQIDIVSKLQRQYQEMVALTSE